MYNTTKASKEIIRRVNELVDSEQVDNQADFIQEIKDYGIANYDFIYYHDTNSFYNEFAKDMLDFFVTEKYIDMLNGMDLSTDYDKQRVVWIYADLIISANF